MHVELLASSYFFFYVGGGLKENGFSLLMRLEVYDGEDHLQCCIYIKCLLRKKIVDH